MASVPFQIIPSAEFAVDTFFLLSGFLAASLPRGGHGLLLFRVHMGPVVSRPRTGHGLFLFRFT
jgi:hypothetical protein